MSVRLRAGARAVLRREGLVRALDAAARTQVVEKKEAIEIHCLGENGFGALTSAEERPHDKKCPYKSRNGRCYTSLDKCSARVVGKPAEKVCCFAERILKPTLDMCDPNNTHSVYQCPNSKYNSTFFENMGYRGQSCEDERMLWEFIDQPFPEGWTGVC